MSELNYEKLANVVLYLTTKCPQRPGLTALLKMLWYADRDHYRRYLKPITGATYVALERGPVLDDYTTWFQKLEDDGVVEIESIPVYQGKPKREFKPKMEPTEDAFCDTELEVLAAVVERYGTMTGNALSEATHRDGPWSYVWDPAEPGRRIPYELFRWSDNLPTEETLAVARRAIESGPIRARIRELDAEVVG